LRAQYFIEDDFQQYECAMEKIQLSQRKFLLLPATEIARIVKKKGRPKVGIFVPDGNRRMTLAFSGLDPQTDEFYSENARMSTQYFMGNLKVFFEYGLQTLFVPLISSNVFERNEQYQRISLQEGLNTIFQHETWLNFYNEYDIRIKVYGDLNYFKESECEQAIDWIMATQNYTAKHQTHRLFYGFASPKRIGDELMKLGIDFYKLHGREPTYDEQVKLYYGEYIEPADFFIMSTKLAGLGALPPLISGGETQLYFLAAPGVMALTQDTYRKILYDYLFCRPDTPHEEYTAHDLSTIESLKEYYTRQKSTVIGLGRKIGSFWLPSF